MGSHVVKNCLPGNADIILIADRRHVHHFKRALRRQEHREELGQGITLLHALEINHRLWLIIHAVLLRIEEIRQHDRVAMHVNILHDLPHFFFFGMNTEKIIGIIAPMTPATA